MDIYFGSNQKLTDAIKNKFVRFNFNGAFREDLPSENLWNLKQQNGESIFIGTDCHEIIFDGYIPGLEGQTLDTAIRELAGLIIKQKPVCWVKYSGIFNLALRETDNGDVWLTSDPSAMLPLYYCHMDGIFYYGSHMHIMADLLDAGPDYAGIAQKMVLSYTLGQRTLYRGISRLNPGEIVHFKQSENILELKTYPEYYTSYNYTKHLEKKIYESIYDSFKRVREHYTDIGLMLSEGFDSRFLGGLAKQNEFKIHSYTHYTPGAGGQPIVEKVVGMLNSEHHFQSMIEGYTHSLLKLDEQLYLADNLNYPFWMLASDYFRQNGFSFPVIIGSSLDCILGGNLFYKSTSNKFHAVWQRYIEIIRQDTGLLTEKYIEELSAQLIVNKFVKQLSKQEKAISDIFNKDMSKLINVEVNSINEYIRSEFDRIYKTGSLLPSQQLQRFTLENRDRKLFFGQPLTVRKYNRIYIPSFEYNFLKLVSSVNPKHKLHHNLYLNTLWSFMPEQLRIANGAYGLKPSNPRLILETSRIILKLKDLNLYRKLLENKGNMCLAGFRSVSVFEVCGRSEAAYSEFRNIIQSNQIALNTNAICSYITQIKDFKIRAFTHERLFRAHEVCHVMKSII